jgi:hypothetical protein
MTDQTTASTDPFTRDRWARPVLAHPLPDGPPDWHWRPSSIGGLIADRFGIEKWSRRMVLAGAAARPDLLAKADTLDPETDKKELDGIADACREAAAASKGANYGTALHRYTEQLNMGVDIKPLDRFKADINAYQRCLEEHRIEILTDMLEVPAVWSEGKVAGSIDNIVGYRGRRVVMDLKTGKHNPADWTMIEYAAQLACYANSEWRWDNATQTATPLPELDTEIGLILWLPVGLGHAELIEVDLTFGVRMVRLAQEIYWGRKNKDAASVVNPEPQVDPNPQPEVEANPEPVIDPHKPKLQLVPDPTRHDLAAAAIHQLVNDGHYTNTEINDLWPDTLPSRSDLVEYTDSQLDVLAAHVRTWKANAGTAAVSRVAVDDLIERLTGLPEDLQEHVSTLAAEHDPPLPNIRMGTVTLRTYETADQFCREAETVRIDRADRISAAMLGMEVPERAAIIEWATEQRPEPVNDAGTSTLTELETRRVCAAALYERGMIGPNIEGTKSEILKAGKQIAQLHDLPAPKSSADVAADTMLTALVINTKQKEATQ